MKVVDRKREVSLVPALEVLDGRAQLEETSVHEGVSIYSIRISRFDSEPVVVHWRIPAINIKCTWSSNLLLDKRLRADWELAQLQSSISVEAPLLSLVGHQDQNRQTFACSESILPIQFEAGLREEDNHVHCRLIIPPVVMETTTYEVLLWIDRRNVHFSESVGSGANWIRAHLEDVIAPVPNHAVVPTYSTWYAFHQDFTAEGLLSECKLAKQLGMELIIVDDGWQTMDDRRGYDFTGDWEPVRFTDVKAFIEDVHALDMKVMFWFSVPFCGKKSKAYQQFQGKFLTEEHPWAPVFDPRYPEVRQYLVGRYARAIGEWGCDGLKLDFIDDFHRYPETPDGLLPGMDTASVSRGVQALITETKQALHAINPEVLIEFRQKYISPALQVLGNMFRAFDCPNDSVLNRVRTTDVKLLCGDSAVHSDMITWHPAEPIELSGLQLSSILFSVPQLSIRLEDASAEAIRMIKFYLAYWIDNRDTLLLGSFQPQQPLQNYPIIRASGPASTIIGVYADVVVDVGDFAHLDIINGKQSNAVVIRNNGESVHCSYRVVDCFGVEREEGSMEVQSLFQLSCPTNGLIELRKTVE